jgi:hypothetical protein
VQPSARGALLLPLVPSISLLLHIRSTNLLHDIAVDYY